MTKEKIISLIMPNNLGRLIQFLFEQVNSDEEWIAFCYGSDLKYFACVLKETTEVLTVKFLERKADGCYEIKKAEEDNNNNNIYLLIPTGNKKVIH